MKDPPSAKELFAADALTRYDEDEQQHDRCPDNRR